MKICVNEFIVDDDICHALKMTCVDEHLVGNDECDDHEFVNCC